MTMVITTSRDARLLLRKTEGIREWQTSLETLLSREKQRHKEMQSTHDFWSRKQFSDCHNAASQWLSARDNIGKNDKTDATSLHVVCENTNKSNFLVCNEHL